MRAVSPQRYLWNNSDYHLKFRDSEARSPRVFGVMEEYPVATNRLVSAGALHDRPPRSTMRPTSW